MRPRLALLLVAASIVAGCGERERDPAADRAAVQKRVSAYVAAMLAGDGERACAQLSPAYRADAERRARASGVGGCAEAIAFYGETISGTLPKGFARQAADPANVQVTLKGDAAEAALRLPGGQVSIRRTTLRRVESDWLIDALGIARPTG
jgi:hypothetical protein